MTHDRLPLFGDFRIAWAVVACLRHLSQAGRADTLCYVVMPDHLHWLLQLEEG